MDQRRDNPPSRFDTRGKRLACVGVLLLFCFAGFWLIKKEPNVQSDAPTATAPRSNPPATQVSTPAGSATDNRLQEWLAREWDSDSFAQGLELTQVADPKTRAFAVQKLFSKRRVLTAEQMQDLKNLLRRQIRDSSEAHEVVTAIRALVGIYDEAKANGIELGPDASADAELFLRFARDKELNLTIRGTAIRALGDLEIENGRAPITDLLQDTANLNTPEISRNASIALLKLAGAESFDPIHFVMTKTSDKNVFGTTAYCLGQINTPEALTALVGNAQRFPDSASCDAALVNMDKLILETLSQPDSPALVAAIKATEHLWKDGQREKYLPPLRQLIAGSEPQVKRASCERLIDAASRLPFEQEKQELAVVLRSIDQTPALRECADKIRLRMSATVLIPATASAAVPAKIGK